MLVTVPARNKYRPLASQFRSTEIMQTLNLAQTRKPFMTSLRRLLGVAALCGAMCFAAANQMVGGALAQAAAPPTATAKQV
jgi:bacterioferritin-associated ferredoxin